MKRIFDTEESWENQLVAMSLIRAIDNLEYNIGNALSSRSEDSRQMRESLAALKHVYTYYTAKKIR